MKYYNIPVSDSVAIGDGNDIIMNVAISNTSIIPSTILLFILITGIDKIRFEARTFEVKKRQNKIMYTFRAEDRFVVVVIH